MPRSRAGCAVRIRKRPSDRSLRGRSRLLVPARLVLQVVRPSRHRGSPDCRGWITPNAQAVPARHPARLAIGPEKAPGDGTAGQGCGLDPAAQAPVAACTNRKRAIEQAGLADHLQGERVSPAVGDRQARSLEEGSGCAEQRRANAGQRPRVLEVHRRPVVPRVQHPGWRRPRDGRGRR
jgi:hypothetical protein